jgi:hypothetical protein
MKLYQKFIEEYTIKCIKCGKELKGINNPDFAKVN